MDTTLYKFISLGQSAEILIVDGKAITEYAFCMDEQDRPYLRGRYPEFAFTIEYKTEFYINYANMDQCHWEENTLVIERLHAGYHLPNLFDEEGKLLPLRIEFCKLMRVSMGGHR